MGRNCVIVCTALSVSFSLHSVEIEVSNDVNLGSNVCINQADTSSSSLTGLWHFLSCPDAENFRLTSSDRGGATLCQGYNGKPGIGIDVKLGEVTVKELQLECESETGTRLNVVGITVYFSECFCTHVR